MAADLLGGLLEGPPPGRLGTHRPRRPSL